MRQNQNEVIDKPYEAINLLVKELKRRIQDQLVSIILYGSLAINDYVAGKSDIDLLIVLKDTDDRIDIDTFVTMSSIFMSIEETCHVSLSPVIYGERELLLKSTNHPLLPALLLYRIRNHGKTLYGKEVLDTIPPTKEKNISKDIRRDLLLFQIFLRNRVCRKAFSGSDVVEDARIVFKSASLALALKGIHGQISKRGILESFKISFPQLVKDKTLVEAFGILHGSRNPKRKSVFVKNCLNFLDSMVVELL